MLSLLRSNLSKLGQSRGQLLDLLVFIGNMLLVEKLSNFVRQTDGFHPVFGLLLILAAVFYSAGAWLKRRPLQHRLMSRNIKHSSRAYILLFILLVMHLGLFIACLSFAIEVLENSGLTWVGSELAAGAGLLAGLLPTAIVLMAMLPERGTLSPDPQSLRQREFLADLMIYLALIVLFAWWDGVFLEMLRDLPPRHWVMELLLSVLMLVPFAIFYLAPRILFLLEDYLYPSSWFTIASAMLPLIARHFPMVR